MVRSFHTQELAALSPTEALEQARERGLKQYLTVPYPVRCPVIDLTAADPSRLASVAETGTIIDPERFLDTTTGVVDAIALLGPPVMCSRKQDSPFMALHLAPKEEAIHAVTLQVQEGELVQVTIDFEPPVPIGFAALADRWGVAGTYPRAPEGPWPGADRIDIHSPARKGILAVGRINRTDPLDHCRVHRLSFSRFRL